MLRGGRAFFLDCRDESFAQEPNRIRIRSTLTAAPDPNRTDEQPAKAAASPARDVDLAKLEKEFDAQKGWPPGAERLCKLAPF